MDSLAGSVVAISLIWKSCACFGRKTHYSVHWSGPERGAHAQALVAPSVPVTETGV